MRKNVISLIIAVLLAPMSAMAQKSFSTLWKQVAEAEKNDLPKTAIDLLTQISERASQENAYGHMLKAESQSIMHYYEIAADSLKPAIKRLEEKMEATDDEAAKATIAAVLYRAYNNYRTKAGDSWESLRDNYATLAMARPDVLARTKANDYEPLVTEGYNASVFNGDMLSVIGNETRQFGKASKYYETTGNRRAACITALYDLKDNTIQRRSSAFTVKKSPYIYSLDSLINTYKDLDVACEAAIERYYAMTGCKDVKVEDRITYIHYILDNWGAWQNAGQMRNEEKALTNPRFTATVESLTVIPHKPLTVSLKNIVNLKSVTANIYSTDLQGNSGINITTPETFKKHRAHLRNFQQPLTVTRQFAYHPNYEKFSDSLVIEGLPIGVYVVELTSQPTTQSRYMMLHVSDVFLMKQALPGNQTRYVVVSRSSGKPLAGANIDIKDGKTSKTLHCDKNGEAIYKFEKRASQNDFAYTSTDKAAPTQFIYSAYYGNGDNGKSVETEVFTDRSIYRPGQTVNVSAVCYRHENWITAVADEGRTVKVSLHDPNSDKTLSEKTLTADKYGTVSTSFILPEGGLNGIYLVMVDGKATTIRVEEYKRPTFKVEFPKVNSPYHNGDTLQLQGKALSYAGVPVQGARVSYKVTRNRALWWTWRADFSIRENEVVKTGETITDGEGRFDVDLPMILPEEALTTRMFYNFTLTADVTDISGETRIGTLTLPLGTRTTAISSNLGEKELSDSLKNVTVSLKNAAGIEVSTDVRLRIDNGEWLTGQTMKPIALGKRLATGCHTLTAICDSDTLTQKFIVFGLDDKVPCTKTDEWFYCSSTEFPDNGEVTIQAGSSDDIHMVYSLVANDKVIEQGSVEKKNALLNRKLHYKKEYGNGLTVTFAWVKDGKMHKYSTKIARPKPDKRLTLKWTTFRDRLLPGQEETWQLNITKPDGKPADARLMATMYDKSLDQIANHQWSLDISRIIPIAHLSWESGRSFSTASYLAMNYNKFATHAFEFSRFYDSMFSRSSFYSARRKESFRESASGKIMMSKSKVTEGAEDFAMPAAMETKSTEEAEENENAMAEEKAYDDSTPQDENIRENMSETAFFYPQLTTDHNGTVSLKFTLPETLTSWRMMGVANTTDMMTGYIEGETVAQKEVMVQPNLPRFLRTGDKTQLTARIFNTGNKDIEGTIRMDIIDPETEKVVRTKSTPFRVAVDKTTVAAFDFTADDHYPLLIIRMVANGKTFSDGEQHYIAVLPEKELVTVTKTFTQTKPETTTVNLQKLFDVKDETSRLTVEYTNNPAWLMIQALPQMAQPRDNNAIDQAASLYSNALARQIAKQNPDVMKTFRLWKNEKAGEGSLVSNLSKNLELKDIVLSETPWVNEAETETEQKYALAMLFDENAMEARLSSALDKLHKLQNSDGSWSWWQGMTGSRWMTQGIATMLARMATMTSATEANEMLDKAMSYLDKETADMVREMKKTDKKNLSFPGTQALEYLYTNAILNRKLTKTAQANTDFLLPLLKKESTTMSMYAKAMSAIVLNHYGDTRTAKTYLKSIVEHTVSTETDGRYFDSYRATTSWRDYKIPTQTAAIEALWRLGGNKADIIEMQRWLLQQKRTQTWDTPVNSIDAINAFMLGNSTALGKQEQTTITIDNKPLALPKATAGMGYQKTTQNYAKEKQLKAEKTSQGTSWGTVYAQFMQDATAIADSGEGLVIKREIESPAEGMKVGSRIKVRITIEAKRDLDFVEVIDRRAACMEPIEQLSGYRNRAYCMPKDNATYYFLNRVAKGKHIIETEYFIGREGTYDTGTCTAQCAYAPEFKATTGGEKLEVLR